MLKTSPFVPRDVGVGIFQLQANKKQRRKKKEHDNYSLHNSGLSQKRANQKR
jgi:hypothetical protein